MPIVLLAALLAQSPKRGELTHEEINTVIKQAQPRVRECFDVASSQPEARARETWVVLASWRIKPDGSVERVTIDQAPIPSLGSCIATVIRHLQFPKPRGDGFIDVRYPLRPKAP